MEDLQFDKESANRFINSLSKSLQALCHGCMDFDAGIEIVGYINVNIDSGSKVDYVLNEKVMKSTTNSMTFVSNSFLAKKEQPKTCRDGSCSPIPELNVSSRNYDSSSQLYRSSGIYSPHSQVLTGPQKRAHFGGDWRTSPRKYPRGAKSQNISQHQHPSHPQTETYSYSCETSTVNSHHSSSYTSKPAEQESEQQGQVNIKQEVEDGDDHICSNHTSAEAEMENQVPADFIDNIKADPDALLNEKSISNLPTTESDSALQKSFLIQTKSESQATPKEAKETHESSYDNSSHNSKTSATADDNPENLNENSQGPSWANAGYDESEEMYPQSSYSEEPSDIIEIDDEVEDTESMYGDAGHGFSPTGPQAFNAHTLPVQNLSQVGNQLDCVRNSTIPLPSSQRETQETSKNLFCSYCQVEFFSTKSHIQHMNEYHPGAANSMTLPFACSQCNKGFSSLSGLYYHKLMHKGVSFNCPLCPRVYNARRNMLAHLASAHNKYQCHRCKAVFFIYKRAKHNCLEFE